jgi:putative ABC transport system permease protein
MNRIKSLLLRRKLDRDLAEEIRLHLDERVDELLQTGMSNQEASRLARLEFGNVARIEEQGREVWRFPVMDDLLSDIRFAVRQLRRSPSFSLASVLILALGIGANTAVFSVVNAVILRPLSYPDPQRLTSVESIDIRGTPHPADLSYPTFFDFRKGNEVFDQMVCYRDVGLSMTGVGDHPAHLRGEIVSSDLFGMLGIQPLLGRGFLRSEETAGERVVILSHEVWLRHFSGDAAIIGKSVDIEGAPHTIIGVAPEGFSFPPGGEPVQIWTTLARDAISTFTPVTEQRGARMLDVMARLKPGVSIDQAQAQMDSVAAALAKAYPNSNKNLPRTRIRPALENVIGSTRTPLLFLLVAVGLVLVVVCANIANLLLARTAERAPEFAIRAAIGAGQGRIVRQLITESLLLSVIGSVLGVLAAALTVGVIGRLAGAAIARIDETNIDARVLCFSIALALVTSLLFGLAPALKVARGRFSLSSKEGSKASTDKSGGLRDALCVAQIALGLVLLTGAGLMIASFTHLMRRDLGFQPQGLQAFRVQPAGANYTRQKQLDFHARLLEALRGLPGVEDAALATPPPMTGSEITMSFNIEERPAAPGERHSSTMAIVSPGYFRTIGALLINGREFGSGDDEAGAPVVIVNQAFADRFFHGENPIGKRIEPGATSDASGTKMREIVGVVGNARQSPLHPGVEPIYYLPYGQMPWCCPSVIVRTRGGTLLNESAIGAAVASLDKQLPVYGLKTLNQIRSNGVAGQRFQMILLSSFAGISLLLTVIGLYGVLAYSVARRTREIGVRIALGASRTDVVSLVMGKAILLVLLGIGIGLVGAYAVARVLTGMIYGVSPQNPMVLGSACVILAATASVAAYLPARRAVSIDPMQALRSE